MNQPQSKKLSRREFVARAAKAGVSIAAATGLAYWLYDAEGPQPLDGLVDKIELPDFSVPAIDGNTISIVKGVERVKTIRKAIDLIGGIERFIKPNDIVLIKPNIAFASPARLCATTNPELLSEVISLCYRRGLAKKVIVADNPINNPQSCFTLSGIGKAAESAGAHIIMPKDYYFKTTTLKDGKLIKNWPIFFEPFKNVNKVIGIAPVKDHDRSGASMTMKNWYGLLGGRRNIFHQDINTIISELAMLVKPTLVILDGTEVMMTNGPTGGSISDLKRKNTMIVGCDQVAVDSFGASLLDLKVSDLPYLAKAQAAGIGITDYESLKPMVAEIAG